MVSNFAPQPTPADSKEWEVKLLIDEKGGFEYKRLLIDSTRDMYLKDRADHQEMKRNVAEIQQQGEDDQEHTQLQVSEYLNEFNEDFSIRKIKDLQKLSGVTPPEVALSRENIDRTLFGSLPPMTADFDYRQQADLL
mmetsp:Transcript_6459/g.10967  ORF Transcript_6459/g.10967 Transcript_6459/m.10967 type:complete len:137 (-) Transcript_6459:242-652(-)